MYDLPCKNHVSKTWGLGCGCGPGLHSPFPCLLKALLNFPWSCGLGKPPALADNVVSQEVIFLLPAHSCPQFLKQSLAQYNMTQHGVNSIPQHLQETGMDGEVQRAWKNHNQKDVLWLVLFSFKSSLKLPESKREGSWVDIPSAPGNGNFPDM